MKTHAMPVYKLSTSKKYPYKYDVIVPSGKTIRFGHREYSDYTKHKDTARKERYVSRHHKRENWTKSGIESKGFWSRWILWNKPGLTQSIRDTERRFGITIHR